MRLWHVLLVLVLWLGALFTFFALMHLPPFDALTTTFTTVENEVTLEEKRFALECRDTRKTCRVRVPMASISSGLGAIEGKCHIEEHLVHGKVLKMYWGESCSLVCKNGGARFEETIRCDAEERLTQGAVFEARLLEFRDNCRAKSELCQVEFPQHSIPIGLAPGNRSAVASPEGGALATQFQLASSRVHADTHSSLWNRTAKAIDIKPWLFDESYLALLGIVLDFFMVVHFAE